MHHANICKFVTKTMVYEIREYISLILLYFILLAEGSTIAVVIAIFTVHARDQHNAGQTFIGICISLFYFANILTFLLLKPVAQVKGFCVFGGVFAGASMVIFALADLLENVYLFEVVSNTSYLSFGIGSIFFWSYGMCTISIIKPNFVHFLIPAAMFIWYFGLTFGSLIGPYMYTYLGYITTIGSLGSSMIVFSILFYLTFPSEKTNEICKDNSSLVPERPYKYLYNATSLIITVSQIISSALNGFTEVTVTLIFEKHFSLQLEEMAVYITITSVTTVFVSVAAIAVCYLKWSQQLFLFKAFLCIISPVSMIVLNDASPANLAFFQAGYMLTAATRSISSACLILVLKALFLDMYGENYKEFIYLKASTVSMLTFGIGCFLGQMVLGGILTEYVGSYFSLCGLALSSFVCFVLLCLKYPFKA